MLNYSQRLVSTPYYLLDLEVLGARPKTSRVSIYKYKQKR